MDESNDVQDTAQLLIFIRGVSASFEVSEELAALKSLKWIYTCLNLPASLRMAHLVWLAQ